MRNALFLLAATVALFAFAGSTPMTAPPLEELTLASFPPVSVEQLVEGAQPKTAAIPHVSPEKFQNLIVEPSTGLVAIDFAALGGSLSNVSSCRNSSASTATGCVIGDSCWASTTYGLNDGGTALAENATLTCYVSAANAVTFKLCWTSNDGGAFDPGAGLFIGKCVH